MQMKIERPKIASPEVLTGALADRAFEVLRETIAEPTAHLWEKSPPPSSMRFGSFRTRAHDFSVTVAAGICYPGEGALKRIAIRKRKYSAWISKDGEILAARPLRPSQYKAIEEAFSKQAAVSRVLSRLQRGIEALAETCSK